MKRIVDASAKCTRRPYLTHSLSVNMRTFPWRGQIRLRMLTARSVENRYRNLSLTGFDALDDAVDGKEAGLFGSDDIATMYVEKKLMQKNYRS